MLRIALIAFAFLLSQQAFAQEAEEVFAVSSTGYNLQPQVAFSPVSNSFLVVWLFTEDILTYDLTRLKAAQLRVKQDVTLLRSMRISRPSLKKRQAPGAAIAYHEAMSRFLVLWQEINGEEKILFLTTLDDFGVFGQRVTILAREDATLISRPLLAIDPVGGRAMAAWTKLDDGKVQTVATSFDPADPNFLTDPRFVFKRDNGRLEVGEALVHAGDVFRLVSCLVRPARERCVEVMGQDIDPVIGAVGGRKTLTREKIRRSMVISAAPAEEATETLVAYDQTGFEYETSVLAVLLVNEEGRTATGPSRVTNREDYSGESRLLPGAEDGFARILWLERSGGTFTLKLQAVTEEGDQIGEPQIVREATLPIAAAAMAYGLYRDSVLIVWSEDSAEGGVSLLCRSIDLE